MITARNVFGIVTMVAAVMTAGCHQDMYDQKKYAPLSASEFYRDGQSARPPIEGTVVHRDHSEDGVVATGKMDGKPVDRFPFPVTEMMIRRGQERFNIYCSPCHGRTGDGFGMVVQRGFPRPPSYFTDSVRALPVGRYVDVITNGFGRMYGYGDRVAPRDRWAIAAYIRVLQASRSVNIAELSPGQQELLK
ncbi:MAG TPA: cytochrome c [Bacteroidota bacterium]|nr:cytochrome c [Bacteroidota bacterium]